MTSPQRFGCLNLPEITWLWSGWVATFMARVINHSIITWLAFPNFPRKSKWKPLGNIAHCKVSLPYPWIFSQPIALHLHMHTHPSSTCTCFLCTSGSSWFSEATEATWDQFQGGQRLHESTPHSCVAPLVQKVQEVLMWFLEIPKAPQQNAVLLCSLWIIKKSYKRGLLSHSLWNLQNGNKDRMGFSALFGGCKATHEDSPKFLGFIQPGAALDSIFS